MREVFYSCAWTHDVRREAGIAAHWRKWPILCVAGIGKEVKILDGYSGALLKVIQGHGGVSLTCPPYPLSCPLKRLPSPCSLFTLSQSTQLYRMSLQLLQATKRSPYGISAYLCRSQRLLPVMVCWKNWTSGVKDTLRASVFASLAVMPGMSKQSFLS